MTEHKPTVNEAWLQVMGDVQAIRKQQRNTRQGFSFRGIDDVMNAVGPALRKHGVAVVPVRVDEAHERISLASGKGATEVRVGVTYSIIGPAGDRIDGYSVGESMDTGDKATAKAMSVAYRTFLLQALTIPTDEPDPDLEVHEQGVPDPVEMARAACRVTLADFCDRHGIDQNQAAEAYMQTGGTADPEQLRRWLERTYMKR